MLKDCVENENFELPALLTVKNQQMSKTGRPYLSLRVTDKSGSFDARVWDHLDRFLPFSPNDIVLIKGKMVRHQGVLQAHLTDIMRAPDTVSVEELLPQATFDVSALYQALLASIEHEVNDPSICALLLHIFKDEDIAARYRRSPAARTHHHAYLGGLLEHSLGLFRLALSVLPHYPKLDRSVVLAGVLLHDIGKIYEISPEHGFQYTDDGRLIGHLMMGVELVTAAARAIPNFPEERLRLVKHTIAAHHGQIEYGSPVLPQTLEAIMVHFLDNMDSKLAAMTDLLVRDRDSLGNWTTYNAMYNRAMYKTEAFRPEPVRPQQAGDISLTQTASQVAPKLEKKGSPSSEHQSGASEKSVSRGPLAVSLADSFAQAMKK